MDRKPWNFLSKYGISLFLHGKLILRSEFTSLRLQKYQKLLLNKSNYNNVFKESFMYRQEGFMFAMCSEAWTNTKWLLQELESKLLYESRDIKIVLWHEFTGKIILKASKWQNLSHGCD